VMRQDQQPTSLQISKNGRVMVYFARQVAEKYEVTYGAPPDTIYTDFAYWGVPSGPPVHMGGDTLIIHMGNRPVFEQGYMSALGWKTPLSRCFVGQMPPDAWAMLFASLDLMDAE